MNAVTQFLLLEIILGVVGIAAVARVWRASTLDGVLSLFVPFYLFVSLFKYWNDPDHHIRWHVLILAVGGVLLFYTQQRVVHALAEQQEAEMRAQVESIRGNGEAYDDDEGDDSGAPSVTIEFGPASRLRPRQPAPVPAASATAPRSETAPAPPGASVPQSAPVSAHAPAPAPELPRPPRPEPAVASAATTDAVTPRPSVRQALAAATFQRGRIERQSAGFALELPPRFRALAGSDARHVAASFGEAPDTREVAWVLDEDVALESSSAWHVSVRWLDDGRIAASGPAPDAAELLRAGQRAEANSTRLVGSGGVLIGYAVAPDFAPGSVAWVEERLPSNAVAGVLDCHALRFGDRGTIEFSVVGAAAGMQSRCHDTVRALARGARFVDADGNAAAAGSSAHPPAPYSLRDLVAHLK